MKVGSTTIEIVQGDITVQDTDAIVNATNSSLLGGGGVDGAIHRRGGPSILEECRKIRNTEWKDGLPTGKAVITTGGKLKARYVIHTVGPIWEGGHSNEPELLADCYRNCLDLAKSKGLKSISFPSISTGAYGYPIEQACRIALKTVYDLIGKNSIEQISFVLFSQGDLRTYEEAAKLIFKNEEEGNQ